MFRVESRANEVVQSAAVQSLEPVMASPNSDSELSNFSYAISPLPSPEQPQVLRPVKPISDFAPDFGAKERKHCASINKC